MSELANYSIETDHIVLLAFKDGRRLRVPVGQLPMHLASPDLDKVRGAIRLRRDFLRRHMPKAALVLIAGGLIALLALGGHEVAQMMGAPRTLPSAPDHTGIVRSEGLPTPANVSTPQAGTGSVATATDSQPAPVIREAQHKRTTSVRAAIKTSSLTLPSPLPSPLPSLVPSPSISPVPVPGLANGSQATPTPTPTPQIPNQGQVLGSCTSPDPTACTDSGSVTPQIP